LNLCILCLVYSLYLCMKDYDNHLAHIWSFAGGKRCPAFFISFSSRLSFQIRSFPSLPTNRFSLPWRKSDVDGTQRLDDSYHARIINFKRVASVFPTFYHPACPFFKTWRTRSMYHAKKMRVAASSFSYCH